MTYLPAPDRYTGMTYRFCGRSGLQLPLLSLGLWHNFGDSTPMTTQRQIVHTAFDLGVTHFDLANNYGPPYGSAETNFGRIVREDLAAHRVFRLFQADAVRVGDVGEREQRERERQRHDVHCDRHGDQRRAEAGGAEDDRAEEGDRGEQQILKLQ